MPTITTACLPSTVVTSIRCWVAGWGRNDFTNTGAYQAIQKEVDVPLVDQNTCQNQLRATRLGSNFALDFTSFVCAGGEPGKGERATICRLKTILTFSLHRRLHWRRWQSFDVSDCRKLVCRRSRRLGHRLRHFERSRSLRQHRQLHSMDSADDAILSGTRCTRATTHV